MTVRVNKSPFNIREKLSELGRNFGVKGSELAAAETVQEARDIVSAGRKNLIFNGDFRINQRYGTTSSAEKDRFTVDRWFESNPGASNMTHQTVQEAPDGFVYSEKMTMGGSVYTPGSNNTMFFAQSIEGYNVAHLNMGSRSAKSFTVSFWVRSSLTGRFSIGINNTTGGNPVYNATHAYVTQYSINSANTWEYKTVTFPGAPIGTWATDNTGGLCLVFDLGSGSGHDGTLNQWSASDNFRAPNSVRMGDVASSTWQITGVQLEVGSNATEFEHRSYGEELALCQRYYGKIRLSNQEWIYNESNNASHTWWMGYVPFSMRANPNVSTSDLTMGISVSGLSGTVSSVVAATPGDTPGRISMRVNMSANSGTGRAMYHTDGWSGDYIAVDAEL